MKIVLSSVQKSCFSKMFAIVLCFCTIMTSSPLFADYYYVNSTRKDTVAEFNDFLERCSTEERIQLMQSLRGLDDKIKDEYFGDLIGLPGLEFFTTDKKKASQNTPLKPKTFNEVSIRTVEDAITKGYLTDDCISTKTIKNELVWRRYNKLNYVLHSSDNINYHEDIVKWVAGKNDIKANALPTYELERKVAEKFFERIWDKLTEEQRQELLRKIDPDDSKIANKAAIATYSGAVAITALSTTVAFAGFAFYTTMSTVICTVAGWLGMTLPFAAYMGASSTVAILSGPIGWIIAGVAVLAGSFLMGKSEPDTIAAFVITVNSIKAKWKDTLGY